MKVARLFCLVLAAVFAVGMVAASLASASGDPEFIHLPAKKAFKSDSGVSVLRSSLGEVVTCESDVDTGEITSMDEVGKVVVHFLGCSVKTGAGSVCTIKTEGVSGTEGLVITKTLRGLLGLVHNDSEATTLVGILFEPETSNVFVQFAATGAPCETPLTSVEGKVAGEISPILVLSNDSDINLQPSTVGGHKQRIAEILVLGALVKPKLTAFGAGESSEETFDLVLWEEPVEID